MPAFVDSTLRSADATFSEESPPGDKMKEKLLVSTVMDSTTSLVPDTVREIPPTLITASVVSDTSLNAANASTGAKVSNPARKKILFIKIQQECVT